MMTVVPLPANEEARLTALHQANILDTEPEARFDRLTQMAAEICEVTMATISFVTADACWPKSQFGCDWGEVPRDNSPAAWVVAGTEPLIISDLTLDERFSEHSPTTGEKAIRFYAGIPLITPNSHVIGVLAVFDDQVCQLAPAQIRLLQEVANLVIGQIDLHSLANALQEVSAYGEQLAQQLALNEKLLHRLEHHSTVQAKNIADLKTQLNEQKYLGEGYSLVARSSNDGVWDWDLKTNKVYFDERWKELLGYRAEDLSDSIDEWLSRIHPDDLELFNSEIEATLIGWTINLNNEHRLQHQDGSYRWVLIRGLAAKSDDGTVHRMAGSVLDVTDSKGAEQQLLHNAFHDVLTGLPNRALFMDRLKRSLNRTKYRPDYLFGALFLDLDRFKVINDSLGHQVGDELLVGIARRLEKCLRPGDMIARLGGDEFAMIIDNLKMPGRRAANSRALASGNDRALLAQRARGLCFRQHWRCLKSGASRNGPGFSARGRHRDVSRQKPRARLRGIV